MTRGVHKTFVCCELDRLLACEAHTVILERVVVVHCALRWWW